MKVCGKRDVLVPECSDCGELEERVEAVEECCDDAHDEIDTLNTGKADKKYVDDSIENVNQTIVDVADTLGERIDNIITASEPSVTTLWEGVMESIGDSANLSEDVNDFDYLDIYYRTSIDESEGYYNTVRIPADQFANYTITVGGTMSPLAESPILKQYLTQLSFVDDTATIDNIREWSWNGSQSSDASDDMQAETGVTIYRIDGVKETGGNAEIADAREGVDGTVYPSLGDAIRGQIQDTRDMIQPCPVQDVQVNGTSVVDQNGVAVIKIPELVKTVQGNPIVLDDAFGEVKNLTVELLPIQEGSGTPSPQNIRPITGHDSVTVTDADGDSQSQSKTVTLPHTVYGAGVGVTSGEGKEKIFLGTVNPNFVSLSEDETGYFWYSTASSLGFPNIAELNASLISNRLTPTANTTRTSAEGVMSFYANNIIRWKEQGGMSLADYKTYLTNNPLQLCYEKATYSDLTTTPEDITLYNGDNVVSSDGDITMDYVQDMAIVIRKLENL